VTPGAIEGCVAYPRRVVAGPAAVAHVLASIVLGAIIVIIGLQLRSRVQTAN